MGMSINVHPDWETEPTLWPFQQMVRQGAFQDRFVCYIIGATKDGRYCRTIEVTGREFERGNPKAEAERIRTLVVVKGPKVCVPFEEGASMPAAKDMPPLD